MVVARGGALVPALGVVAGTKRFPCRWVARRRRRNAVRPRAWSSRDSEELYNVDQWSGGYYSVSDSGDLLVKPDGAEA